MIELIIFEIKATPTPRSTFLYRSSQWGKFSSARQYRAHHLEPVCLASSGWNCGCPLVPILLQISRALHEPMASRLQTGLV